MIGKLALVLFVFAALVAGVPIFQRITAKPAPTPVVPVQTMRPTATAVAVATPARTPVPATTASVQQVELGEQQVNELLRERLQASGYKVDDLNVRLEEGRFVATTTQQVAFFRVPVTVIGEASVVDGQLSVRPVSVTAAGAAVPEDVVEQTASAFRRELAAGLDDLPVRPTTVQIKPGRIVIQGVAK